MKKILVIDDDARNLRLAVAVLEQAHYAVLSANNGPDGTALAIEQSPDLVLMDVQMPGMDGLTALRQLRANPRTQKLTVVALTALAMKGDAERLLAAGFDGYCEKPIQYKKFLAQIQGLLDVQDATPT